jgi:hypothetical protein
MFVFDHGPDEMLGLATPGSDKHATAALDFCNRFRCIDNFGSVFVLPVH